MAAWNAQSVRKDFVLLENTDRVYFDNAATSQKPQAVLDAASEDKIPLFIRLAKSCFDRSFSVADDEVFYSLAMFVRVLLARNCRRPREERLKFVAVAVKTTVAAAEAAEEVSLSGVSRE